MHVNSSRQGLAGVDAKSVEQREHEEIVASHIRQLEAVAVKFTGIQKARRRLIQNAHRDGVPKAAIARASNVSRKTVIEWLKEPVEPRRDRPNRSSPSKIPSPGLAENLPRSI